MKHPVRAVLDTNIVLSALLFASGRLAPIRLAWQRSAFSPLLSRATTEELVRTLGYPKFGLTLTERDELLPVLVRQQRVAALDHGVGFCRGS